MESKRAACERAQPLPVLVTGAAGFLGTAIVHACRESGLGVRGTDLSTRAPEGCADYRPADLLDPAALPPLLKDVGCVIHAAGLAHQFGKAARDRDRFLAVNVTATENMARAAAAAGVGHFVLISSVSVYGAHTTHACGEEEPCRPVGPYAESKFLGEQAARKVAQEAGLRLTILRLATVYGEGDRGNVVRLIRAVDRGRFLWVGKGANYKSLIHRDDVARACVAVAQAPGEGEALYNVAAAPCTMRAIVDGIAAALGKRLPPWHVPGPLALGAARAASLLSGGRGRLASLHGTLGKWLADDVYDGDRLRRAVGFVAQVSLEEGLRREVEWYRSLAS